VDIHHFGAKSFRCILLFALLAIAMPLQATPILHCEVSYGGGTQTVEAFPESDPYGVHAHDIEGRFRFKAVVIGNAKVIDYIKLYVYYKTEPQFVLLHEASYRPPFASSEKPYALTGVNFVYAPGLGYELQYVCTLSGVRS
jgi:hypothetical protein